MEETTMKKELVTIHTETIRLQDLLKFSGAAGTGGEAKQEIQNGGVLVNGAVCTQRGRKLRAGDAVTFRGRTYQVAHAD